MSDTTQALKSESQFLWILFLSLCFILFITSVFIVCHCCFCYRFFLWRWKCGCCCEIDIEEYRRERQHLRQLREFRQRRDLEIAHLATFTQIPGPIPDSYGFRELRRQSAIRDLTSLGFIVVTPASTPVPHHDSNSLQMRNQLTSQQRRDILERLLSCRTYHVECDELDVMQHGKKETHNDNVEERNNDTESHMDPVQQSFAFPLHEEPEIPEKTCAICLDGFAEGELINDASKCRHVFHKDCLLEWLDMHDVCPCCRCTMITDTEWRYAATHATEVSRSNVGRQARAGDAARESVGEENDFTPSQTSGSPDEEEDRTDSATSQISTANVESPISEPEAISSRYVTRSCIGGRF